MLEDTDGTRYVPVGDFWEFARRFLPSAAALKTQMLAVGWQRRGRGFVKASRPGSKETIVRAFYRVAVGWEDE